MTDSTHYDALELARHWANTATECEQRHDELITKLVEVNKHLASVMTEIVDILNRYDTRARP